MWWKLESRPNKLWTLEVLAGAITALKECGQPINPKSLEVNHKNLYHNIVDFPGGWKMIIMVAGFDPAQETRIHLRGKGYVPS